MAPRPRLWVALFSALLATTTAQSDPPSDDEARIAFFEKKVRPLLVNNCYNCHSANTNSQGGLRVDDRNGLLNGGGRGPAIVPGQPEKSLMIEAVRHTHAKVKMPPKKHLSEQQIADLMQWIKDGAAWPKVRVPVSLGKPDPKYEQLRRQHWAWQPRTDPKPPAVADDAWPRDDIDRFILAALEVKGLRPVADADPATLIRRITFDLTGLPPKPEEVEKFVEACGASATPQAVVQQLVDRLLASSAFGERWGRHWLDVARYGESTGSARNLPYPHAWRYRDYVIDAFNADKPYDQFVREQIAGDLLPSASPAERDERLIATGFLALGVRDVNQRYKVRFVMDNIDEQIDTVSRAFLALTVSCARCHDHKFDPIPTTDYYALAGIFHSTDHCSGLRNKMGGGGLDYYDTAMLLQLGSKTGVNPDTAKKIEAAQGALKQARAELAALNNNPDKLPAGPERQKKLVAARQKVNKLQNQLIAVTDPAANGPVAYGARDANKIGDTEIRVRGEAEQLGPVVPRGFLSLFHVPDASKINAKQSGRLELAKWLTSPHHPLTARVMANRIWHHLFGRGLVASVDNFGVTGERPSHPELLDHLAARLIQNGWSVKKLVRAIVLSRTYQLASDATPHSVDPENRLLWRHRPRRLDAEEIRDAMLAVAARLDPKPPDGSPAKSLRVVELRNNGPEAKRLEQEALASRHRSVYLPLVRGLTPTSLEVFDFAEQGMVTGSRDTTTVATQALYLLNDAFVRQQSQAFAERVLKMDADTIGRITSAYRLALGRPPTATETERASRFVAEFENESAAWPNFCQALLASAEFRYLK